jgi:hypothetical protein
LKNHDIQNNMDHENKRNYKIHLHLQALTPCWVLFSFQFWIAVPKGKFYMVNFFGLNIQMTISKCSINRFFHLIFIKVSVEKQRSSSIEPIQLVIWCTQGFFVQEFKMKKWFYIVW